MRTPPRFRSAPALAVASVLLLAGCNSKPNVIKPDNGDDMQAALNDAKPVTLPPSIVATKSLRCADNSVVFVDFYSDGMSAGLHLKKNGAPTIVKAPAKGQKMVADGGWSLDGAATDNSVKVGVPGKPEQSCDTE